MILASIARITSYHAHVYYTPDTRPAAEAVREALEDGFDVALGRWREQPVGPHPRAMFQIAFVCGVFPSIVPWLMLNRGALSVLVHPNTGRPRDDHLHHALWLGERLPLDGSVLPETEETEDVA